MTSNTAENQDNDSLEALFDSIIASTQAPAEAVAEQPAADGAERVFNQLGQLTRTLHDSLRELGYDKNLESMVSSIPDARDRLSYVAAMTEQAAERVLNATDAAQPIVTQIETEAHQLALSWQKLFDRKLDVEQFKALATRTHAYLMEVPKQTKATNGYLMEIMMAQDFQDLTGQVIKKIVDVTQQMEQQLVALLVENAPPSARIETASLLNGPVINPQNRSDVVTSQDQVDDLLESLGF